MNIIDIEAWEFIRGVVLGNSESELKERGLNLLLKKERVEAEGCVQIKSDSKVCSISKEIQAQIYFMAKKDSNGKIEAIKMLRALTHWGLLEAKQAVENIEQFYPKSN